MGFFWSFKQPKAKLTLTTEKQEFNLGEEVKGKLRIQSEEILDIEKLIVSLECVEAIKKTRIIKHTTEQSPRQQRSSYSMPEMPEMPSLPGRRKRYESEEVSEEWESEDYWDGATLFSESEELGRALHFYQGYVDDWAFSLKLPNIGRGTYHSVDRNLEWKIKAKISIAGKRRLAKFKSVETEIMVSDIPTMKETIREVVLIPCKYCEGLMPQTALFCPNCGARRTA